MYSRLKDKLHVLKIFGVLGPCQVLYFHIWVTTGVLLQMVERFVAQNKNCTCGSMLSLDLCAAFVVSNGMRSWKGSQHPNEASALVFQSSAKGTEPGVKEMFLSRAPLWSSFTLTLLTVHHGRATYLVLAMERNRALLMSCTIITCRSIKGALFSPVLWV